MAEIDLNSLTIPSNYDPDKDTFLGTKVGELVVEKFVGRNEKYTQYYKCKCTHGGKYCKGYTYATKSNLVTFLNGKPGGTSSCGCVKKEMYENGGFHKIHDKRYTRIYNIYSGMKARCYNPNKPAYKDYGARGIRVCDEWLEPKNGFINFYNWAMSNGYTDEKEINRKNVDGNYEPSNCEWILRSEDRYAKRSLHLIDFYGKPMSISQVAEIIGINRRTLNFRINDCGMEPREAMFAPKFTKASKIAWENDPNKRIESKPISFIPFTVRDKKQELLDLFTPNLEKINTIVNSLPTAGEFLKEYSNITFTPEELKGFKEPPKEIQ